MNKFFKHCLDSAANDKVLNVTAEPQFEYFTIINFKDFLNKLLLSPFPDKGLSAFVSFNLQNYLITSPKNNNPQKAFPELNSIINLPQNTIYHKFNAWEHTVEVVKNTPVNLVLRMAALLHDIGKGESNIRIINKKGLFSDPKHEIESTKKAQTFLSRLDYNQSFIKEVLWLISEHMKFISYQSAEHKLPSWIRKNAISGNFSTTAELLTNYTNLCLLGVADYYGTGYITDEKTAKIDTYTKKILTLTQTMPVCINDLDLNTEDLNLIFQKHTNATKLLENLLRRVQDQQLTNENTALLSAINFKR